MQNKLMTQHGVFRTGNYGVGHLLAACQGELLIFPAVTAGGFAAFLTVVAGKTGFPVDIKSISGKRTLATSANA
jgi:hypothetical protein